MLGKVITGGQTGADQAGWRAAKTAGLATGGLMPLGFLTEEGPRHEFSSEFHAAQHASPDLAGRTIANVEAADATVVFTTANPGAGTVLTIEACRTAGRPWLVIEVDHEGIDAAPGDLASWLADRSVRVLNVAGDRESVVPGIGASVESFLRAVFADLAARTSGP